MFHFIPELPSFCSDGGMLMVLKRKRFSANCLLSCHNKVYSCYETNKKSCDVVITSSPSLRLQRNFRALTKKMKVAFLCIFVASLLFRKVKQDAFRIQEIIGKMGRLLNVKVFWKRKVPAN